MNTIPTFQTKNLILRSVTEKDLESWQAHFADYEVIRHLSSFVPWPYPNDGVKTFYYASILPNLGRDRWLWGIFLKENPEELIGCVDLWRDGKPENRGFWLARKHWGKGFMTEAVHPVMTYAFNELNFEKLIFSNALGNVGSRRIKEKTGANFLRVEPGSFVDSTYTTQEVWELSKENWNPES